MKAPFEDDFDRPAAAALDRAGGAPSSLGRPERQRRRPRPASPGPTGSPRGPASGTSRTAASAASTRTNHGVWLKRVLPVNARIEFDATSQSTDGDLKAEYWGDGRSFATALSYTNATSYLTIFGGWHNKFHVLARINEHGNDRKEITVDTDSDDPREKPVMAGQIYHFKVERTDGKTVKMVGRRQRDADVRRHRAARGRGPRPLRLQRLGREGLLRQREGRPASAR